MKILFRILVILVVASLIGGAIFAAVNIAGTLSQRSLSQRDGRDGGEERDGANLLFLPFGMFQNLVIIAIIATFYLNVRTGRDSENPVNT